MPKKRDTVTTIISIYCLIHGLLYLFGLLLHQTGFIWEGMFSFAFGNITLSEVFIFIPVFLGITYIAVGYGLYAKSHWARIVLLILCVQALFFEFPVGSLLSFFILVYSFTSSFSKQFPKKTETLHYKIAGASIIIVSFVAILAVTGIISGFVGFTESQITGMNISTQSAEDKITDITQKIGPIDVLIELTESPDKAQLQQDILLGNISQYVNQVKNRFTETSNSMIVNVEASKLLLIAENENVARIYEVTPSFTIFPYQLTQAETSTSAQVQLNIGDLHQRGITGKGITIAVMDTGIKEDHPDLQRNGESIVVGGLHLHGEYVHPHGTMTASCIASQNPDALGVAPEVNILNIEVFQWQTIMGQEVLVATNADIIQGFEFVANWKELTGDYVVLSCSWGVSPQQWIHDAEVCSEAANRLAVNYNIPVIASAGNSGPGVYPYTSIPFQVMSPSGAKNVLSVGAVDAFNNIASFSSRGPYYNGIGKPDVVAPGVDVPVLSYTGTTTASGTSFSCPYISGVVALLAQNNKDLSSTQLYSAVKSGATDLGSEGYDYEYGFGIVNAQASLAIIEQTVTPQGTSVMFVTMMVIGAVVFMYPILNKKLR